MSLLRRGTLGRPSLLSSASTLSVEKSLLKPAAWKKVTQRPSIVAGYPQANNILYHFDFTDLSTLWQDTGGTSAVTADGQTIHRIDNLGTAGGNIQQATADDCPRWDTDLNAAGGGLFLGAGDYMAIEVASPPSFTSGYTCLIVFMPDVDNGGTAFAWDGFHMGGGNNTGATLNCSVRGTNLFSADTSVEDNQLVAVMGHDEGDNNQVYTYSTDAAETLGTLTSEGPAAGTDIVLGARVATPSTEFEGVLLEAIVWVPGLSAADRALAEAQATTKHGVIWA